VRAREMMQSWILRLTTTTTPPNDTHHSARTTSSPCNGKSMRESVHKTVRKQMRSREMTVATMSKENSCVSGVRKRRAGERQQRRNETGHRRQRQARKAERERQRWRGRGRERERESEKARECESEIARERARESERETDSETARDRDRETWKDSERQRNSARGVYRWAGGRAVTYLAEEQAAARDAGVEVRPRVVCRRPNALGLEKLHQEGVTLPQRALRAGLGWRAGQAAILLLQPPDHLAVLVLGGLQRLLVLLQLFTSRSARTHTRTRTHTHTYAHARPHARAHTRTQSVDCRVRQK
jgi:hypothetical protein